jgi:hypothetical protein
MGLNDWSKTIRSLLESGEPGIIDMSNIRESSAPLSEEDTIMCFVCASQMKNWSYKRDDGSQSVHPIDGIAFSTYGHYGSTVFDPMDGSRLEIAICDECITSKQDLIRGNGKKRIA